MKILLIYSFILVIISSRLVQCFELQCYQCDHVTEECEDTKASVIKCGDSTTARCARQVKQGTTDKTRAIRKCVIAPKTGHVNCPVGYECFSCNENFCNANPIIPIITAKTTSTPNSAPVAIYAWSSLATAIFVVSCL